MALSISHLAQLVGFAALLSCGQMLFKFAAMSAPPLNSLSGFLSLLTNFWFFIALALYGTATLLWIFILQQVPLSIAYPFAALGFVIIPLASWGLFKEPVNLPYIAGTCFIVAGLCLIAIWSPK